MTKTEKATLIGLIIGDGYLNCARYKHGQNSSLLIKHSIKQKEYIEWKSNIIHSIFGGNKPKVVEFNNNGYPGVRIMKSNKYFRVLHRCLYKNGQKIIPLKVLNRLTPLAIAIWWMDDGCLYAKKRNGKIHGWELYLNTYLSDEENLVIINYFKTKWNINWKLNHDKDKSRLRCSTKEGRKFLDIVRPYMLPIKCMQYKCINI